MEATAAGSEGVHCDRPALDIRRVSIRSRELLHKPADILGSHLHTVSPSLLSKLNSFTINLILRDWDQVREVHSYPPSTGKLAIYRRKEFFKFVDYVIR